MCYFSLVDRASNPYSPGSGRKPPALIGRERQLGGFETVIGRTANHLSDRGIVLTGLRGVGKTVLLNEMQRLADQAKWLTVRIEARREPEGSNAVRRRLARELTAAARRQAPKSRTDRLRAALGTISSFNASIGATGVSLGVEREVGRADSGDVETDITEVVEDVSAAMAESGLGFAMFIDEMQDLDSQTLGAILAAQHTANQRNWPFFVLGAGLPNLPRVLTESRSYAERLFDYHTIGRLTRIESAQVLEQPARLQGASFSSAALNVILTAADGYPYFLQEFGQAAWDISPGPRITGADAAAAVQFGLEHLDHGFFRARWDRATPTERRLLLALADDGGASGVARAAQQADLKTTSIGPYRAALIAKGLVYSPEHGKLAFTVPGMAEFVARHRAELSDAS